MRFHKVLVLLIGVTSIALAESNSQGQPQALPQPPMQAEPQTQSPILSQEQNRLKFQAVLDRVKAAEPNGKLPTFTAATEPAPQPTWNDDVNFALLRATFAKRADFIARCEQSKPIRAFAEANMAKNPELAASTMDEWLKTCPVDALGHLWAAGAYKQAGQEENGKVHVRWFIGLTDAAMKSFDGKTPRTAFAIISASEAGAVLVRLGLPKTIKQELLEEPIVVNRVTAEKQSGEQQTVYFNPRWQFLRLAAAPTTEASPIATAPVIK